jgi:hypothetical protein
MASQRNTMQYVLLAMLFAAASSAAFGASSVGGAGAGGVSARASIDFQVNVPRVMQMRLAAHPTSVFVTAEDIARGSIKVSGPTVDLLVNDRFGFSIRADLAMGAFSAVKISGLSSPVVATQSGATIRMSSMVGRPKPAPMPVEYELQLAPGAQPGQYAWPVTLSLQQI